MIGGTYDAISEMKFNITSYRYNAYQHETRNLEFLNRSQVRLQLKLGKNDDLVSMVRARVVDNDQGIDVTLRQETQCNFGVASPVE